MFFGNQITTVYGEPITIEPEFTGDSQSFMAQYEGTNIRIDNNKIIGLKSGTVTKVKLVSELGLKCSFYVAVTSSTYRASWDRDLLWSDSLSGSVSVKEKWFDNTTVQEISGMGADFMNGIDISSCRALYKNGTKFYNTSGTEQSLFYILKENGVNWVRMKLWVDPYTTSGVSYGGGVSDLDTDLWIAKEAKAAGLKVLLDFHYSDFWTHPGQQVVPKAWANASSADDLAGMIQTYTNNTLTSFKNAGCLPDMVQLGNEISSGMLMLNPGADSFKTVTYKNEQTYKEPNYKNTSSAFAYQGTSGSDNMKKYLNAAATGVNAVDSNIKKVIHWAKGGTFSTSAVTTFFGNLSTVDYDYAGISFYIYDCVSSMNDAASFFAGIKGMDKPWFIAETSYPFSGLSYIYNESTNTDLTDFTINGWKENSSDHKYVEEMRSAYAYTGIGQANLIHDLTAAVVANDGIGVFYWEGAWVPNKNVGWASEGSLNTWGNQGFFSYNGKAIANINIFKQMSPHI